VVEGEVHRRCHRSSLALGEGEEEVVVVDHRRQQKLALEEH
jgi:hypothetical protein